jgi:heat shock protein HslJ
MMMCIGQNVMETESDFLKTLSSVRYWKVEESNLQLLDSERKPLMRFGSR